MIAFEVKFIRNLLSDMRLKFPKIVMGCTAQIAQPDAKDQTNENEGSYYQYILFLKGLPYIVVIQIRPECRYERFSITR